MDRHVQTISPDLDIMDAVDFLLEKRVASRRFFQAGCFTVFWSTSWPSRTLARTTAPMKASVI